MIGKWIPQTYGAYTIEHAPITLVGTREKWAPGVIPGCFSMDVDEVSEIGFQAKGCSNPATTRIRLRGGLLVQDDDQLVCDQHFLTVEKQMQERIQMLEQNYKWLKDWAKQNPPSFEPLNLKISPDNH